MNRDELLTISREPNVRAMLDTIAACEGTAGPDGYRTIFGGSTFESFAAHPGKVNTATMRGTPISSSAAGRYQFLGRTWRGLVQQYGFPSFEPQWQDAGAVALIAGRGALADVRAGRLRVAVDKLKNEWASLPGSPYGQPTKAADFVERTYLAAGGRLDAGAPIENRTSPQIPPMRNPPAPMPAPAAAQPAQAPAAPADDPTPIKPDAAPVAARQERPMAPILAALLPSLVSLIPEIGKLFGSGPLTERNTRIAEKVAEVVVQATAAPNLQGAVEAMERDPAAAQTAREAVQAVWFDLVEAGGGGITGARAFNIEAAATPWWKMPAFWISIALLPLLYGTVYIVLSGPADVFSSDLRAAIASSVVTGILGGIIGFWLGSSFTTSKSRGLGATPQ